MAQKKAERVRLPHKAEYNINKIDKLTKTVVDIATQVQTVIGFNK
jgi:hypothetical protein